MVAMLFLTSPFCSGQIQIAKIIKKKYGYIIIELPHPFETYDLLEKEGKFDNKLDVIFLLAYVYLN